MKTRKTLWFTLFIVCSLALISGSRGVLAVESGSDMLQARLRILGGQVEAPAGATTELGADPVQSTDVQVNWSGGDVVSYTTQSETSITGTMINRCRMGPMSMSRGRTTATSSMVTMTQTCGLIKYW